MGRIIVNTRCERRLFSTTAQAAPDVLARCFCAPGSHCRWHRGNRSRHQHLQDWLKHHQ
ncbi:PilI type IV pilus biogenesis protein [Escherichia coli]|nr:PilI type IV pilus biogenesis protein [Escherichia coli]MBB7069531.1 PilI type IV pilus biogenesis protein [Escherichia coli]